MNQAFAWLLDANVVSEMMRPNLEPQVTVFLNGIARDGIGLESVTSWEILNGIGRPPYGRRRDELEESCRRSISELVDDRIIEWTLVDAKACAEIIEAKRRRGELLDDNLPDAFLAAAAFNRGCPSSRGIWVNSEIRVSLLLTHGGLRKRKLATSIP